MNRGMKDLLSFLIVLAALGLGFLLAVASCEIYCNGMVGLSFLVGIGGGVLLIVLEVGLIKSIWHPKPKNRIKPSETNDQIPQGHTLQT